VADGLAAAGLRVAVGGVPSEAATTAAVVAAAGAPVLDLTGRTGLGSYAALLRDAAVVVANDTGTAHLAAAVTGRVVTVFLSGDPVRWRHPPHLQTVVREDVGCNPWPHLSCPIDFRCPLRVDADPVLRRRWREPADGCRGRRARHPRNASHACAAIRAAVRRERVGQRGRVLGGHDDRHLAERQPHVTEVGRDGREACRHRLHEHQRQRLDPRGQQEEVDPLQQPPRPVAEADELDRQPGPPGPPGRPAPGPRRPAPAGSPRRGLRAAAAPPARAAAAPRSAPVPRAGAPRSGRRPPDRHAARPPGRGGVRARPS
jgi:hypothetical protein